MAQPATAAPLKRLDDEQKLELIISAIDALTADDVFINDAADALDELSTRTTFEGIEANPDGIFTRDDGATFSAACTIYVGLNYGGSRDGVCMSDSFPATVSGHFEDGGNVNIDDVNVDTTSFFDPPA
jgi:hypothetical protein